MPIDAPRLAAALRTFEVEAVDAVNESLDAVRLEAPDGSSMPALELAARSAGLAPLERREDALRNVRTIAKWVSERSANDTLVKLAGENRDARALRSLLEAGAKPGEAALERAAGNGASKNVFQLLRAGVRLPRPQAGYSSDYAPLSRDLMDSATDGALRPPYDFLDVPRIVNRVRVWVSWLAQLDAARAETLYAAGIDGAQLVVASEEALSRAVAAGSNAERVRFSFGDFAFRSGFSPKFAASTAPLDESSIARRGDEDDRTEAELCRELLHANQAIAFAGFRLSPEFRVVVKGHPY